MGIVTSTTKERFTVPGTPTVVPMLDPTTQTLLQELKMPALSPTMTQGNVAKWLLKEGDKVRMSSISAWRGLWCMDCAAFIEAKRTFWAHARAV